MKSQDVVLMLKLISLQKKEVPRSSFDGVRNAWPVDWCDWDEELEDRDLLDSVNAEQFRATVYTARSLELETGISKTQVNESLRRCIDIGLVKKDRKYGVPRCNYVALEEVLISGVKYFFHVKPGTLVRGIGTAFAAPILHEVLISAGDLIPVWPDASGHSKGLAIEPLHKSVPFAVRKDPELYALLALVDAIRIGQPREANLAKEMLQKRMRSL